MLRNGLEPWHLILVVLVIVLVCGSKRLPDAARGLGKSMRILKAETKALREDDRAAASQQPAQRGAEPQPEEQRPRA